MKGLVVLGGPVVVLGFGGVLPPLVGQVGADQVHLHEWPEHAGAGPLQVVGRHHYNKNTQHTSTTTKGKYYNLAMVQDNDKKGRYYSKE